MRKLLNVQIPGKHGKPILLDIFFNENGNGKRPVAVFAHGFKGFKDWGCWHKVAERFAEEGTLFIKFNFSHNGTTPDDPTGFGDLEAFGRNNFSIELDDLSALIDWLHSNKELEKEMDLSRLSLIGHSRGGGICVIKAAEDDRISKLVTWAGVAKFDRLFSVDMNEWKREGVVYTMNVRTGQQMPLYYQLYEDFTGNNERLNIISACSRITIPSLIVHGTNDEAVPLSHAEELKESIHDSLLHIIQGGTHTFGMKHPCENDELPAQMREVVDVTIGFLKQH